MNFSEALHLVARENEKVFLPLWHTVEWQKAIDIYIGSKVWVMMIHPSMFGLPPLGAHDRVSAFGSGGYAPALDSPQLIQVISSGPSPYSENSARLHRVKYWEPDMQDMLAANWTIYKP